LPPIAAIVTEHRTHQLRCRHCRTRTSAGLSAEIGGSVFEGLELARRAFAAWRSYQHEHHDREQLKTEIAPIQTELRQLLEDASPKSNAPAGTDGSPTTCSRSRSRSGPSRRSTGSSRPTTPPSARSGHRSSTEKCRLAAKARKVSDSPNVRSPPPAHVACNAARCSPT
jgi:hypothetical protein